MVLLDTCALIWWTLDPGKLSKDAADRAIVATAYLKDIPIVSKDSIIKDFYPLVIW